MEKFLVFTGLACLFALGVMASLDRPDPPGPAQVALRAAKEAERAGARAMVLCTTYAAEVTWNGVKEDKAASRACVALAEGVRVTDPAPTDVLDGGVSL